MLKNCEEFRKVNTWEEGITPQDLKKKWFPSYNGQGDRHYRWIRKLVRHGLAKAPKGRGRLLGAVQVKNEWKWKMLVEPWEVDQRVRYFHRDAVGTLSNVYSPAERELIEAVVGPLENLALPRGNLEAAAALPAPSERETKLANMVADKDIQLAEKEARIAELEKRGGGPS